MGNFIKVALFSLFVLGFYTFFSAGYIPPIVPSPTPPPPPSDEAPSYTAEMTMEEFIALGEGIYLGKGACTLCHDPLGVRAPVLERIAVVASERLEEEGYGGQAKDGAGYIYESLVNPSAYVVAGYGVKGTGDKVSPMPDVSKKEIGLGETEIMAVVAYLQDIAGAEVTVTIPGRR